MWSSHRGRLEVSVGSERKAPGKEDGMGFESERRHTIGRKASHERHGPPPSGAPVPANSAWDRLATTVRVSRPQDAAEGEADRVADAIVAGRDVGIVQRGAKALQRACAECEEEEPAGGALAVQRKSAGSVAPATAAGTADALPLGAGERLPEAQRAFFAPRFGRSFEDVRVHADAAASAAASALDARAVTFGTHIAFAEGQYAPGSGAGDRLLAHELTHVVQQSAAGPSVQRQPDDDQDPPQMSVAGDSGRNGPSSGVAIAHGTLNWKFRYVGQDTKALPSTGTQLNMVLGKDVQFEASFTPTAGATSCPTITFMQSVQPTIGGLWDTGPLLYTRSPATGASMDVKYLPSEVSTAPFYGAQAGPGGPGLKPDQSWKIAGTRPGASPSATHSDAPYRRNVPKGATAVRKFETAVICAETAETFGSIDWGYTKTGAGVVTLLGGTPQDVRTTGASADFETTRQAFYSGFFQLSLGGFATASAALTTTQKTALDTIDVKDLTQVILVGANDNSGGAEAKAALSLKRAEAARDYLVKTRGVAASLIKVEGHGVEARVPNPPGKDIPANRRVDVHLERGANTAMPPNARLGSAAERKRILQQNPRRTLDEAVDAIVRLDATSGRVPMAEWSELTDMLSALDGWRSVDPSVPDARQIYAAALRRLEQRAQVFSAPARPPLPKLGPISPKVDDALRRYEEQKQKVKDLERERDEALHRLDEEAGLKEDR